MSQKKVFHLILYLIISVSIFLLSCKEAAYSKMEDEAYQEYIDFFEKVYDKMDKNYYQEISRDSFNKFIEQFHDKIYSELRDTGKSIDYIRWRSASLLVSHLKTSEDIFSEFYPPKPAKEYKQTALGKRIDLGIEGELVDKGYKTTQVEPRSDAYKKGLRIGDIILEIDGKEVKNLDEKEIKKLLKPLADSKVVIKFLRVSTQKEKKIKVISKEYFKQMVFMIQTGVPNIYGLEIRRFNRKTSDDILRYLKYFREHGPIKGLILDLRGNPGGPPLAAREISGYFLPAGDDFAYFKKKGQKKALLDVPSVPKKFHYDGPIAILINKKSGSASELFSGILQRKGRAVLLGTNSAGQVMLKSMFNFDDGSMLLLITSRGHYPDGGVFSFNGLTPNRYVGEDEEMDLVNYAVAYLVYVNSNK